MQRRRIFVAINLPGNVRKSLLKAIEPWRDLPVHWTKEENIHITLVFVGYADDEELSRIVSALPRAVEGISPFEIVLTRIGVGPDKRRARMVWAEGECSRDLLLLQKRVEDAIFDGERKFAMESDAGEGEEEGKDSGARKPFRLHVTLGRMIPFQWNRLEKKPDIEKKIDVTFDAEAVDCMESESGYGGHRYTVVSSTPLETESEGL